MRQRNKPWADDFLNSHTNIVIPNPVYKKEEWSKLFGNSNPIHIEIGTGKGQFLVGMAKKFPDVNFIGIELAKSILVTAVQKTIESKQNNLLLLNENAENLCDLFERNSISTIYLNFSDPWPKNRHEKRRLTNARFLQLYKDILKPDGQIIFKTDNRQLFEYSLVSFSTFGMELQDVKLNLHDVNDPNNVMTEYEEKFSAKGQPIYRCITTFK